MPPQECAAQLTLPPGWLRRMLGLLPPAVLASLQTESFCKHLLRAYYAPVVKVGAGETKRGNSHTREYSLSVSDTLSELDYQKVPRVRPQPPLKCPPTQCPAFSSPQAPPLTPSPSFQSIHSPQSPSGLLSLLGWDEPGCCLPTFPASGSAWTTLRKVHL